jgi:hypothetical protein
VLATLLLLALAVPQEGALDVLDGETLYEDGWLFTLGYEHVLKGTLRDGSDRESDPLDRRQLDQSAVASAHYGLRYDLQLSLIVPYVSRTLEIDDPAGPDRYSADGLGDVTLAAKWRYYRPAIEGVAFNFAMLGGVDLPTGSDDERDHGALLPPDLQPGSGSWDPFLGTGLTYEPGRWRLNAFGFYKHHGEGGHDYHHGDQFFLELAAGNRFWLEPYPGPFMRADLLLRYRHEGRDTDGGNIVHDSGGDQVTVGLNWAFRPRPTLDFQVSFEIPIYESVEGTQLVEDYSLFFAFGVRI